MKRIILSGCNGRMGQVLQQRIEEHPDLVVVAGIDRTTQRDVSFPIFSTPQEITQEADVIIDFSHYSATPALIEFALEKKLPLVVATTGLESSTTDLLEHASSKIPVFYSANMSVGVNVLIKALQAITPVLEDAFNIEIIEKHHNQKKDAPSGTALLLANSINDVCQTKKEYIYGRSGNENENHLNEMGIHAVRGGTIPGEHTILFAGEDEIIELKHTALSRSIFANGALKAGIFLADQPIGFYSMSDLVDGK